MMARRRQSRHLELVSGPIKAPSGADILPQIHTGAHRALDGSRVKPGMTTECEASA